jgi:hypothetical protein
LAENQDARVTDTTRDPTKRAPKEHALRARIIGTIHDITDRKHVEHEVRFGRERLELLSDTELGRLLTALAPARANRLRLN